jgi:flagellar basal-body rod protein FlgB
MSGAFIMVARVASPAPTEAALGASGSGGVPLPATGKPLPFRLPFEGNPRLATPSEKLARRLLGSRVNFCAGDRHVADNSLFGVHAAALEVRSQRMGLLASNIANASTPGYKAKDIDFQQALSSAESTGGFDSQAMQAATKFRVPLESSMDGNTVDLSTEQTAFAENAIAYQTTLSFLNRRIGQITRALKGE